MKPNVKITEQFFKALQNKKIKYAILRNVEEIKSGEAHDIDMTVDANYLEEVEETLYEITEKMGWKRHLKNGSSSDKINIKSYHFFISEDLDKKIYIVHFDIFTTFSWKEYILINNKCMIDNIDESDLYHRVSPEIEAITKFFIRLLHNGYIKQKYKEDIYQIFSNKEYEEKIFKTLNNFLDTDISKYVIENINNKQWDKLEKNRKKLVKSIKKKAKKCRLINKIYLLKKIIKKSGIMIVFEGTDGSGKSTIINNLPNILGNTFSAKAQNYYHWRPGFIKKNKGRQYYCR